MAASVLSSSAANIVKCSLSRIQKIGDNTELVEFHFVQTREIMIMVGLLVAVMHRGGELKPTVIGRSPSGGQVKRGRFSTTLLMFNFSPKTHLPVFCH